MSDALTLDAAVRTEFGKGAARRTRRDGNVPAVLYGHHTEPQHLSLNAKAFAAILRKNGTNAVLTLNINGEAQLALTKSVVVHPIRRHIEHADLLVVKRGEKVTVDIPVVLTGEPAAGGQVNQDLNTLSIEVEAMHIPEQIEVSISDIEIGGQLLAGNVTLPAGATLAGDAEALVVAIFAIEAGADEEATEGDAA